MATEMKSSFYYHHSGEQGMRPDRSYCKELKKGSPVRSLLLIAGETARTWVERYATVLDLPSLETEAGSSLGLKPDISFELAF